MMEETDRLLQEIDELVMSMNFLRQSEEVKELMRRLQNEDHAYPQLIISMEEN